MGIYIKKNGLRLEQIEVDIDSTKFSGPELKKVNKIKKERNKLIESFYKKIELREKTNLFWSDDDSPYKIDF